MDNLFTKTTFLHTINVEPKDINNQLDNIIKKKVKDELECICNKYGYIKKDSIDILNRSLGQVNSIHFTGNIIYNLTLSADICNPLENTLIKSRVVNVSKMGVLAKAGYDEFEPLNILLAKQHHINNDDFADLDIGNTIVIKVIGKRFEYGDNQISIIAVLDSIISKKSKGKLQKDDVLFGKSETKDDENQLIYNNRDNSWLSTSHKGNTFEYNNRVYETVENCYQSEKIDNESEDYKKYQDLLTYNTNSYVGTNYNDVKKIGSKDNFMSNNYKLKDNWDLIKIDLMKNIISKYLKSNLDILERLIKTGDSHLIYRNNNGSMFWGTNDYNEGENNHAKILMELRTELSI